ncbi:hypothetical protein C8A01DRAFT_44661 [Parachaetomium inaequale]|uniref:Uncharacterized protein n=1 Tax=Parachaetomium inaequale TaxID=2588326 RepID=A0AAN6PK47_9PEZI|nr:hypothetical protein C8A01DRAFT_44661 [Parachaetomium inaequale]
MAKPTPAARLRRTFHYPSDDDDASSPSPEVLDEQEQESLITTLAHQNETRNKTFHRLLTTLPLLSSLPFLLDLFLGPSTASPRAGPPHLLPLLGLSSLFATGWMLHRLGVTETGFAFLDTTTATTQTASSSSASDKKRLGRRGGYGYGLDTGTGATGSGRTPTRGRWGRRGGQSDGILGSGSASQEGGGGGGKSPLETHLPRLNIALALLALLTGLLQRLRTGPVPTGVSPLLLGALPGVVYAVTVGAKVVMAGVDPERELSALKYGYKGA